ncbi:hypothetical protein JMJ58_15035 [Haloterrigena salifodinae]|uniref:Uncharacterized protein n=1 Tax=Haloterrigena salifodinae TaxID=2675099 RepID=A0A8T8DXD4_9EURY|nr:hypothetical protein [Haloterrigena salifodinae]QRV14248.1 hypothetical protein JMJ58_15035 [Haloterrigena salifodinae]
MNMMWDVIEKIRNESLVYYHNGSVPEVEPPREDVTVEWITEEIVNEYIEQDKLKKKFRYFLDVNHSGVMAYDNESWLAYGWISKPESTDTPYQLPDWIGNLDLYWMFFARTKEKYRESGWHKYLLAERLNAIYNSNSHAAIFTDTSIDNVSRLSMLSSGFEPKGKMSVYRFGYPLRHVKTVGCWDWGTSHPPLPNAD